MKTYKILLVALAAIVFSSCGKHISGEFWGETEYYSNFLFKKYEPVVMEKTLEFDFNDDAQRLITGDIEFEVVKKDEHDAFAPAQEVVLYKNGAKCANNILKVKSSEKELSLGIEFTKEAREGYYTLYLREKGASGLDRIEYLELTNGFCVRKSDVWNPLANGLFYGLIGLILFLLLWYILSRRFNPNNKFSKIYFDYHDGAGEQVRRGVGSCYKVVCVNKMQRVSPFSKFFVGNVFYEVNDFWTSPVTLKSGTRNTIKLSGVVNYELDSEETIRKEPFTLTNENGQKATITTA